MRRLALLFLTFFVSLVTSLAAAQGTGTSPQLSSSSGTSEPPVETLHSSTRMVTLEVVARDHQGRPATGLTAKDFQVFEQAAGWRREKREQKIAAFRALGITEYTEELQKKRHLPAGIFSNQVMGEGKSVPPTILLIDGLNTDITVQMQVHVQMVKMLNALPSDVPVAVFLLGHRLRMLQTFTSDPSLLKAALEKASSFDGRGMADIDPRDDPDTLSALLEKLPGASDITVQALRQFEQETYASTMDLRVAETAQALVSIARHVAGYPGRKNLLWISSSFPILLVPDQDTFTSFRNYTVEMQQIANVLGDARIAVYPIDPAGLRTPSAFTAGPHRFGNPLDTLSRESNLQLDQQATMEMLADQTGGRVCVQNNDLGDCVRKAVNDSSAFYEIAYYPTSTEWNGEFRKIMINTKVHGLHLAYRQGYFARSEEKLDPKHAQAELKSAACEDYLNATSVLFAARMLPSDSPDTLKYYIAIDAAMLNFSDLDDGGRELKLVLAVCTFNQAGKPLQLITDPIDRKMTATEYRTLLAIGGYPHVISLTPTKTPAAIRLVVKDVGSGHVGSLTIPVEQHAAIPRAGDAAAVPH